MNEPDHTINGKPVDIDKISDIVDNETIEYDDFDILGDKVSSSKNKKKRKKSKYHNSRSDSSDSDRKSYSDSNEETLSTNSISDNEKSYERRNHNNLEEKRQSSESDSEGFNKRKGKRRRSDSDSDGQYKQRRRDSDSDGRYKQRRRDSDSEDRHKRSDSEDRHKRSGSDSEDRSGRHKHKSRKSRRDRLFRPKKTAEGYDWRGLPMITYLGVTKPDYDRLDKETISILKEEMIGNMRLWRSMDKSLGIGKDEELRKLRPHSLHHQHDQCQRIMTAKNSAIFYKQAIVGGSHVMDLTGKMFGFKQDFSYAQQQITAMPIYNTTVTDMAMAYGSGPLEGFPPYVKFGAIIVGGYALNFILSKASKMTKKNKQFNFWVKKFYQMADYIPDNNAAAPVEKSKKDKEKNREKNKEKKKAKKKKAKGKENRESKLKAQMFGKKPTVTVEEVLSESGAEDSGAKVKSKDKASKSESDSEREVYDIDNDSDEDSDNDSDEDSDSEALDSPIPKAKKAKGFDAGGMLQNVFGMAAPFLGKILGGDNKKDKKKKKKKPVYDQ